ncbi:MAG TPA: N-acyl homoserine lactonase family protein [Gammaproteobacteria bacterium]|nr:N-acyl homoserine lactonase family protein [Gammaproteobacteria bacterium]
MRTTMFRGLAGRGLSLAARIALFAFAAPATLPYGPAFAQDTRPVPASVRIYVFDNGTIKGLAPALFNFKPEELARTDLVLASYLIVHPKGTLMFDSGGIPDAAFPAGGGPAKDGFMSATKPLRPQLAAIGYKPSDITYFALSHYHSDHTGNANDFAGATWIVQKAERDYMFSDDPDGIIEPAQFAALENAKTKILDNESFDVFGDGTVVVMPAPGHTPGHQVVAVKLAHAGTVVLAGDLYHYPEERATGRIPTFEADPEASKASRAMIEAYLKEHDATLWIEHDLATFEKLPKAPAFVD